MSDRAEELEAALRGLMHAADGVLVARNRIALGNPGWSDTMARQAYTNAVDSLDTQQQEAAKILHKEAAAPASPCRESAYGHISKQAEAEDPVRSVQLADGWSLEWLSDEVCKLSDGRRWVAINATAGQAIAQAVATRADCDRANRKVLILLSTLKKISEKLKDYGDAQRDLGNIEVAQDFAEARLLTIPNDYNLAAKLHEMEADREEGTAP